MVAPFNGNSVSSLIIRSGWRYGQCYDKLPDVLYGKWNNRGGEKDNQDTDDGKLKIKSQKSKPHLKGKKWLRANLEPTTKGKQQI
jgi:hypothetical protein